METAAASEGKQNDQSIGANIPKKGSDRVAGIDALRGVAALAVATFHLYSQNTSPEWRESLPDFAHLIMIWGRWGVQLFFVISGFVIAYTLNDRKNFDRLVDFPLYFARRVVRLDTLYFVVLAIFVVFRTLLPYSTAGALEEVFPAITSDPASVAKNIFYFLPIPGDLWLPVAWTLGIEVQFYVAMAGLFILLNMTKQSRHSAWLIAAAAFLSLAYPSRLIDVKIGFWLMPSLFNLLAGSLLYFLVFRRSKFIVLSNVAFAGALGAVYWLVKESHVLATLLSYLAVLAALFLLPARVAAHPVATFLGRCSYGIYLLHMLIGLVIVTPLVRIGLPILSWGPIPLAVGILGTVLAAWLLYVLIERPSIVFSKRIGRGIR
jgi:peptidoglycan/LPS O-acetylase OafA/YrhL